MSIAKCSSNPALRPWSTSKGMVTLEEIGPQNYRVWRNGVSLGRVFKLKHWFAERTAHPYIIPLKRLTRTGAIEELQ